jgi:hypothetical protein
LKLIWNISKGIVEEEQSGNEKAEFYSKWKRTTLCHETPLVPSYRRRVNSRIERGKLLIAQQL